MAFGKRDKRKTKGGRKPFQLCNKAYTDTFIRDGRKVSMTKFCMREAGHSGACR
jgi:hypothetical protein